MLNKKILKVVSVIFVFINILNYPITSAEPLGDKIEGSNMINSQEAIVIALADFQKTIGELPNKFELIVEDQIDVVKISLITELSSEGGSLEIKIDKKAGNIVERIVGQ